MYCVARNRYTKALPHTISSTEFCWDGYQSELQPTSLSRQSYHRDWFAVKNKIVQGDTYTAHKLTKRSFERILALDPDLFSQAVITCDFYHYFAYSTNVSPE